jgi:2-keto-4-pentenoate hydratase/2-oxohepta-3-ene-1,7-dioic acid hydratase in catechol pathway
MKIARFGPVGSEIPAIIDERSAWDLRPITNDIDGEFLASGGIARARSAVTSGALPRLPVEGLRRAAPIARPGKIVCIGLNYRDHARETNATIPEEPIVFMKDSSTMVGPDDDVRIPWNSTKTDWEVELGVIISSTARYLESPVEALACIAGFAVSHDVSEREFQLERGGQWDKGKSCETFNPLGPWLIPFDDAADHGSRRLDLYVNGELRQHGSTDDMIFDVGHIIWYLSQFMVLHPGDLINTGTPAGVALGLPGNPYLRSGDVVQLSIEGLGTQRQQFIDATI